MTLNHVSPNRPSSAGLAGINRRVGDHMRFRRTRAALQAMPMATRFDLALYDGDFDQIARRPVYRL